MAPLNESSALTPPTDRAAVVGRRRSTTGLAQAKRKAWGREWGAVGAALKRQRQAEGR